jgi:hypothetical protein
MFLSSGKYEIMKGVFFLTPNRIGAKRGDWCFVLIFQVWSIWRAPHSQVVVGILGSREISVKTEMQTGGPNEGSYAAAQHSWDRGKCALPFEWKVCFGIGNHSHSIVPGGLLVMS